MNVTLGQDSTTGKWDTMNHYGDLGTANIVQAGNASYHEYGKTGFMEITAGHVVVEEKGKVIAAWVDAANASSVSVDVKGEIKHAHASSQAAADSLNGSNGIIWDFDGKTGSQHEGQTTSTNKDDVKYEGEAQVINALSVNGMYYKNMSDVYNMVAVKYGQGYQFAGENIITLYKDIEDFGVVIESGSNVVFDLNGHTYSLKGSVGSQGTTTNGFQILDSGRNNNPNTFVTIKNGTLKCVENNLVKRTDGQENVSRILQVYGSLTLKDMTIDGTNMYGTGNYIASFNNSPVSIEGNTNFVLKSDSLVAFDADGGWSGYDRCKVTINTTGKIGGFIELGQGYINIQNVGSISGIKFCTSCGLLETTDQHLRLTKASSVNITAPEGYSWNAQGTGLESK